MHASQGLLNHTWPCITSIKAMKCFLNLKMAVFAVSTRERHKPSETTAEANMQMPWNTISSSYPCAKDLVIWTLSWRCTPKKGHAQLYSLSTYLCRIIESAKTWRLIFHLYFQCAWDSEILTPNLLSTWGDCGNGILQILESYFRI